MTQLTSVCVKKLILNKSY